MDESEQIDDSELDDLARAVRGESNLEDLAPKGTQASPAYTVNTRKNGKSVTFQCGHCQSPLESPLKEAGQMFKCPICHKQVQTPGIRERRGELEEQRLAEERRRQAEEENSVNEARQRAANAYRAAEAKVARAPAGIPPTTSLSDGLLRRIADSLGSIEELLEETKSEVRWVSLWFKLLFFILIIGFAATIITFVVAGLFPHFR